MVMKQSSLAASTTVIMNLTDASWRTVSISSMLIQVEPGPLPNVYRKHDSVLEMQQRSPVASAPFSLKPVLAEPSPQPYYQAA